MTCGIQLVELVFDAVADAALQQGGDVFIQFAVLPPQCSNRHGHGRLHLPQAHDRAGERVSQGPSPGGPRSSAIPLRPRREAASPARAVWRGTPESPLHHMGDVTSH